MMEDRKLHVSVAPFDELREGETQEEEAEIEEEELEHLREIPELEGATYDLGVSGEQGDPEEAAAPETDESFEYDDLWWQFQKERT